MDESREGGDVVNHDAAGLSRRAILRYGAAATVAGLAASARPSAAHAAILSTQALGDAVGWDGHLNGQVPLAAMTAITYPNSTPFAYRDSLQQIYMRPDAAVDLVNWLRAYYAKFGTYLKLNEGYRTLAGQRYWAAQAAAGGDEAAPVGRSNHGLGQAIDFERSYIPEGSLKLQWLRDSASTYGFVRYSAERWHFDYTRPYAPTSSKGLLMALSDAEQAEVLATVRALAGFLYAGGTDAAAGRFDNNSVIGRVRSLQDATFNGGTSMQDNGKPISQSLAEIQRKLP